jgi:hypothetical protein
MRWKLVSALVTVAAILALLFIVQFFNPLKITDFDDVSGGKTASTPKDLLAGIQRQLKTAEEFDAELRISIYYQDPVPVRIAWRKPEFLFIHVGATGDNPATWYWIDNQQLYVYEESPSRPPRGICVNNLMQIAEGDAKNGFELALSASKIHAYYGYVALSLFRFLQDAGSERLENSEMKSVWRLTGEPHTSNAEMMELFVTENGNRSTVVLELPKADRADVTLATIRIEYGSIQSQADSDVPPEAGIIAEIDTLQFSLDRTRLKFPTPSYDSLETVDLKDSNALNVDFSWILRPVTGG